MRIMYECRCPRDGKKLAELARATGDPPGDDSGADKTLRPAQLLLREVPLDPAAIEWGFSLSLVDLENGGTLPAPLIDYQ